MSDSSFNWSEFYMEFADKLLEYRDNRKELIDKIYNVYSTIDVNLAKLEGDDEGNSIKPYDIDPFTVFALFNKQITHSNRLTIIDGLKKEFSISAPLPENFKGIPRVNNLRATFYYFNDNRGVDDIENLWDLFSHALDFSNDFNEKSRQDFIDCFNKVIKQLGIKWNITMGLFWIRPFVFVSLDEKMRNYLSNPQILSQEIANEISSLKDSPPEGDTYLKICDHVYSAIKKSKKFDSLIKLSLLAMIFDDVPVKSKVYNYKKFLDEVFISEKDYDIITKLLQNKKNLIVQGAPGVGKTFLAKRLAYSIMEERDVNRVMMVQFHQSYSYEDFVMGYRPSKESFKLKNGAFYDFCEKAKNDGENDYFFIIDEINRGNLSKIFGELFMLIEKDKRGKENKIQLLYSDDEDNEVDKFFYIPANVYIIGLMNTADRSLAMIDYALRRRFAFFDLKPGFSSKGFKAYQKKLNSQTFNKVIEVMERLNTEIENDGSLGEGFRIGHSYFCNLDEEEDIGEKLNYIIDYEIIPLIKEYWFDNKNKVDNWTKEFKDALNNKPLGD